MRLSLFRVPLLRRPGGRWYRPTSLRWRLTAWVAVVLLVSAAVTGVVVYRDTGQQLRTQIDHDLGNDAVQLSQTLQFAGPQSRARLTATAGRYLRAQPYDATATVLVVLVPGGAALSNHPELLGSASPDDAEDPTEQQRENALGRELLARRSGFFTLGLPDVGDVRLLERNVLTHGRVAARVIVGEPLVIVTRAQRGVARAFVLAGVLILVLALLASYIAGSRVSAPLRQMAAVAARVDGGDLYPRMSIERGRHDEMRVLADTFNHMLDRLSEAFAAQRAFVADASHELRTPLTVIRGQLEVLAAADEVSRDDVARVERLVRGEVARISRLVDDLLLLAQSERTDFLLRETIAVAPFITELWEGVTATADRRFSRGEIPPGRLNGDPDRLAQALRNLARNAIEHTAPGSGLVALSVQSRPGARIVFAIEDDGPGIAPEERERIFERFHRTDVARSRAAGGAGLGLAIVHAIATAHDGQVSVRPRPGGGSRFELELPGFIAEPAARRLVRPIRAR